jgi:hypothetical protein
MVCRAGVYLSSGDAALGKVTVSGLVDPGTVLKKLQKAGKPVRLWGEKSGVPLEITPKAAWAFCSMARRPCMS